MAIRFGSSDPKIWPRFRVDVTVMIIRGLWIDAPTLISAPFLAETSMHIYS